MLRVFILLISFLSCSVDVVGATQSEQVSDRLQQEFARLWDRAETLASVESENKNQAWLLDVDAELISPFLNYWAFPHLLESLLSGFSDDLSEPDRAKLVSVLKSTFARYVVEVLFDYRINSETISDVIIKNNNETLVLQAKIKGPLGVPVSLEFNSVSEGDSILITDMIVGGIAYSDWKRRYYKSYAKKNDITGLINALRTKNSEFFVRFCEISVAEDDAGIGFSSQLPAYIQQSCALENGI
jgi:ABC-type transporter MlaC component